MTRMNRFPPRRRRAAVGASDSSWRSREPQAGGFVVEFAILLVVFFAFIFGVLELARMMYLFNTLQEVTRRAGELAAVTDFSDATAMASVRHAAVFRDSAGGLRLGTPITDQHVRIDYMSQPRGATGDLPREPIATGSLPSCPAGNRLTCLRNPNDGSCIRFVRVRICDPADATACNPVPYETAFPLIEIPVTLPTSTTIATAGSLGFTPGAPPSCP